MTLLRHPAGAEVIAPACHPVDGQPGTALRLASGVEVLYVDGVVRSLPADWRQRQPYGGSDVAQVLTATLVRDQSDDGGVLASERPVMLVPHAVGGGFEPGPWPIIGDASTWAEAEALAEAGGHRLVEGAPRELIPHVVAFGDPAPGEDPDPRLEPFGVPVWSPDPRRDTE